MTIAASMLCLFILVVGAKAARYARSSHLRFADSHVWQKPHHSHRFLVAQRVQHGLQGTPLQGLGWVIEAEAHRRNLSPYFMVGASGTESSLGAAGCQGNPKNIYGLGSCDRYWKVPYFETWRESFRYYADFIRSHWPHARTVYDLSGYCECGSSYWGSKTLAWMRQLFGPVSERLEYPR